MSYHSTSSTQIQVNNSALYGDRLSSWNNHGESEPSPSSPIFIRGQKYYFQYDIRTVVSGASIQSYEIADYGSCTVSDVSIVSSRYLYFAITPTSSGYFYVDFHTFSGTNKSGTQYNDYFKFYSQSSSGSYARRVRLDANGGSLITNIAEIYVPSGSSITLPGSNYVSRSGYIFGGWNTSSDGSGTNYSGTSTYTPSSTSVYLYARWRYTISLTISSQSQGSVTQNSVTVYDRSTLTVSGNKLTFTDSYTSTVTTVTASPNNSSDYIFANWNNGGVTNGTYTLTSATTYTAYYSRVSYSWTIATSGCTVSSGSTSGVTSLTVSAYYNESVTVTATANSGYTFDGWYRSSTLVQTGTTLTLTGGSSTSGTYTAKATSNTQSVKVYFKPSSASTYYYKSFTINYTTYDRSAYGNVSYITFDFTKGTSVSIRWNGDTVEQTVSDYQKSSTTYSDYSNSYSISSSTSRIYPSSPSSSSTQSQYRTKITFNANGGSGSLPVLSTNTDYSDWSTSTTPTAYWTNYALTKDGYTFLGWAESSTATTYSYTSQASLSYGAHTLYAVWILGYRLTVAVATDSAGRGTVSPSSAVYVQKNTRQQIIATPVTVTCEDGQTGGYSFSQWAITSGSGSSSLDNPNSATTNLLMGSTATTVRASFVYRQRNVSLMLNHDDISIPYETITTTIYGKLSTFPSQDPVWDDGDGVTHTFVGWNTVADGTGSMITSTNDVLGYDVVKLYAIWGSPTVTITYDTNDSNKPSFQEDYTLTEATITITLPNPGTKSGYYFAGWCRGSTSNLTIVGTEGSSYTVYSSVNLIAYWKRTPLITFDANGGVFSDSTTTKTIYTEYVSDGYCVLTALPYTTPPTYNTLTLTGWEYNGSPIVLNSTQFPVGYDYTVTAIWGADLTGYSIQYTLAPSTVTMGQSTKYQVSVTPSNVWQTVVWSVLDTQTYQPSSDFQISNLPSSSQEVTVTPVTLNATAILRASCSIDHTKYADVTITATTSTTVTFYVDFQRLPWATVATNGTLTSLPTAPTEQDHPGYVFDGWFLSTGKMVVAGMSVPTNMTCDAVFTPKVTTDMLDRDLLVIQVLNPERDAVMTSLDLGSITAFKEIFDIKCTATSTPLQSSEKTFVIDEYIRETINVDFLRANPVNADDTSGDSRLWSNAKWFKKLKAVVNRWQGSTDGIKLLYLPLDCEEHIIGGQSVYYGQYYRLMGTVNPDPTSNVGFLYNGKRYVGVNAYIRHFSPKYSAGEPQYISGSIEFYIGGMLSNYYLGGSA